MRRRNALFLALGGLLALCTAAQARDPRPGEAGYVPPPSPSVLRSKAHFGTSPFEPPKPSDTVFVIDQGAGLDTGCTFRSGGPLSFAVNIGRVAGNVTKLKNEGLISEFAELRMPAFDVDFDAPIINPERDRVSFNGHVVPTEFLTGADGVWKLNTFQIPIEWVNFADDNGEDTTATGKDNVIRIDIDTANSDELWCTSIDWAALSFRLARPVVMVHGILSSGDKAWSTLWVPQLNGLGLPNTNMLDMGALDSIQNNALKIADKVAAAKRRWGVDKVNLVCHSKGGLDSRHFVEHSHDVDQVIQIGTPNAGSPLADIVEAGVISLPAVGGLALLVNALAAPAGLQLTTVHMQIYNLLHGANPEVRYTALAGNYVPACTWGIFCAHPIDAFLVGLTGPGDSIVPITSVHSLPYTEDRLFTTSGGDNEAIHTRLTEALRVFNLLSDRVDDPSRAAVAAVPASAPALSTMSQTATEGASIVQGQTQVTLVPIDPGSPGYFSLLYASGDLSLTLVSPSGQRYSPSGLPAGSSASFEKRDILGGMIQVFRFNSLEAGLWRAEVTALSVTDPSGTAAYTLNAWLDHPSVTFAGGVARTAVHTGERLELRGTLRRGNGPLTGAQVVARVARPDNSVLEVTLHDDGAAGDAAAGDGIYSADLTDTTQPGVYRIAFKARGTGATSPPQFSRESFLYATVSRSATTFSGTFSAHGVDTNGNGLFEELVVDLPVAATVSGSYRIYGVLTDAQGNRQETSVLAQLASAGTATVSLHFDGPRLFQNRVDGPYTLSVLRLAEEKDMDLLPLEERVNAFQTPGFSYRSFEHGPINVLGTGTSTGVDTNGNGLFDQLDVAVDLDLDSAAAYTWSAKLVDFRGTELGFASGSSFLDAGRQTLQMSFPGEPIGRNGVGGPYFVTDLLIFGNNSSLVAAQALATAPFAAHEFEGFQGDTTPPTIQVALNPSVIWPPDRRIVEVAATITVQDDTDPNPRVSLVSIVSSDPDSGTDPNDVAHDIQGADLGADDRRFQLRAERGTADRVYRVTYKVTDLAGNSSLATATVTVRKPK